MPGAKMNMELSSRKIGLQAILFAAWPPLTFIAANLEESFHILSVAVLWLAGTVILALIGWAARAAGPSYARRIFNVFCVLYLVLFMFGAVDGILKSEFLVERARWSLIGWAALFVLIGVLVWWLSRAAAAGTILGGVVAAMCVTSLFSILTHAVETRGSDTGNQAATETTESPAISPGSREGNLPDVFAFVLDGYGRSDNLRTGVAYDNSGFLKQLAAAGFKTPAGSISNYPISTLSISSALLMDYHAEPGPKALENYVRYQVLLAGHNPIVRALKSRGYKFVQAPPGSWAGTDCRGVQDLCIRSESLGLNETQIILLQMTPLELLARRFFGDILDFRRTKFPQAAKEIAAYARRETAPVFAFTHLIIPHDPIYTPDCRERGYAPFVGESLSPERRIDYAETIACLNSQILKFLPDLMDVDQQPIILLLSDHGFTFGNMFQRDVSDWKPKEIRNRFGNLISIQAPEKCRRHIYDGMSLVNSFRFVLGCIDGTPPQYLRDRMFLAKNRSPKVLEGQVQEVR